MNAILTIWIWGKKFCLFIFMGFVFFSLTQPAVGQSIDLGLITATSLHQQVDAWRILDGRPRAMWKKGHIPQSRSFYWEDYTGIDGKKTPYRVFLPEKMAKALEERGITETTPIAVYGDADQSWGGEAWICWVLTWLGHKGPVRLLSGGIDAWKAADLPVTAAPPMGRQKNLPYGYRINERKLFNITPNFIDRLPENHVLVDTRSFREWITGDRLPNAAHISWKKFYTGPHHFPISKDALTSLLGKNGISEDQTVVYYCTGGIRSSFAWLVHEIHFNGKALNYEGGTEGWKRRQ